VDLRTHLWLSEDYKARAEQSCCVGVDSGAAGGPPQASGLAGRSIASSQSTVTEELLHELRTAVALQCGLEDPALPPSDLACLLVPGSCAMPPPLPPDAEVIAGTVLGTTLADTGRRRYQVLRIAYRSRRPLANDPFSHLCSPGDVRYVLCVRWGFDDATIEKKLWPARDDFCMSAADARSKELRIVDQKIKDGLQETAHFRNMPLPTGARDVFVMHTRSAAGDVSDAPVKTNLRKDFFVEFSLMP
jgi:hypothetical protein